jgi:manganese transport protein
MLLLAAASLPGVENTDSIQGATAAITEHLGAGIGIAFGIALLASGLASTSVGAYAGSEIMGGLLRARVPLLLRRLITLIPALVVLALGIDPTWALVLSQVVLSFGIPFAIIPLIVLTGRRSVMGEHANRLPLRIAAIVVAVLITALNLALLALTFSGAV